MKLEPIVKKISLCICIKKMLVTGLERGLYGKYQKGMNIIDEGLRN